MLMPQLILYKKNYKQTDKPKILVLCGSIYPHRTGGAEIHAYYVSNKLVEKGYNMLIITFVTKKRVQQQTKNVFKKSLIKRARFPIALISMLRVFLVSYIKRKEFDVTHVHMALHGMIPAYMLLKTADKPYVVTCHGSDVRIIGKRTFTRMWQKILLQRASYVVAVSIEIRDLLIQKYGLSSRNITLIPNGFDEKLVKRLRAKTSDDAYHKISNIVFLGNLREEKDPTTLIKVFRAVSQRVKNVHLQIVGNGPLRKAVERKIEFYKLQEKATLHGKLPHVKALEVLAYSDIFVLTSVNEGLPTSLIEAMALGKAVVATSVGGVPEIITDGVNGLLTPPNLPDRMAQAVEKLLKNPILAERLKRAASESVKDYSWNKIAEKYEKIYRTVLSKEGK